jgi:hypothetical protein
MILRFTSFKIFFLIFIFSCISQINAQEKRISVYSNIDSVRVFIDSEYVGLAPLKNFPVAKDSFLLSASDDINDSWSGQKLYFLITLQEDTTVNLIFKNKLYLRTTPDNAAVYSNKEMVGYTPLFFTFEKGKNIELRIIKDNYGEEKISLDSLTSKSITLSLKPIKKSPTSEQTRNGNGTYNKNYITYLIIGGIASGLLSGYSKMRADHFEAEYNNNKNESTKKKINIFDTISDINLIIFESCLLTVNYLLLKD